jgi:hypothetical protein
VLGGVDDTVSKPQRCSTEFNMPQPLNCGGHIWSCTGFCWR